MSTTDELETEEHVAEQYRFAAERKVWWPTTIYLPVDHGRTREIPVEFFYEVPDRDQSKALSEMPNDEFEAELKRRIHGWSDNIADENGKPIPFNKENLDALMAKPEFMEAAHRGLLNASLGAAVKN